MKKYLIINILIVGLLTGCNDLLDVNTDPNNPVTVTPALILPVAQNYTARYIQTDRSVSHLGNMMMYNWSESAGFSWYNDEFLYLVTTTFYSRVFDNAYIDALKQYSALDNLGEEYNNYVAISKIMKSYHFQLLVDFYGDIPYSEALGRSENSTPKYDGGEEVYLDLIVQLNEAIALINAAAADAASEVPDSDDIMFGGNMTQWKQFANTIKARILNRYSGVASASYISGELANIVSEGSGYITSDVQVQPGYANETDQQNPFWEDFGASVDGTNTLSGDATCATDYILDYYTYLNDPRIDYIYEEPATGHLGVPQGITSDPDTQGPSMVSNIGPGILIGSNQGASIFTVAESFFNQAELALNGFGGDPETLYNSGVIASFSYLGTSGVATYLAQTQDVNLLPLENVNYIVASNKLEAIITQKWIALNGITAEQSWFDYSRTGYPSNLPISVQATTSDRPVRLMYPASEVGGNTANVRPQKNPFTDKIFWAN
ncbi:Cell surface glycan-binding lipoprotein, utilization system for glycans and polysaccharides (PUL), SusD family [hydrothermal vent metagenome]|uniref:Cell surface glycan-binding lipoprotein, utilization system for glycans and polysaccharides (PUL), SusD family n=1 Tax=hydrothermal vent metagenome TaxID=652676 RepID=A0A3B1DWN9_9ZZZZ